MSEREADGHRTLQDVRQPPTEQCHRTGRGQRRYPPAGESAQRRDQLTARRAPAGQHVAARPAAGPHQLRLPRGDIAHIRDRKDPVELERHPPAQDGRDQPVRLAEVGIVRPRDHPRTGDHHRGAPLLQAAGDPVRVRLGPRVHGGNGPDRTLRVSISRCGSRAAACSTASQPRTARATAAGSVMSPVTTSVTLTPSGRRVGSARAARRTSSRPFVPFRVSPLRPAPPRYGCPRNRFHRSPGSAWFPFRRRKGRVAPPLPACCSRGNTASRWSAGRRRQPGPYQAGPQAAGMAEGAPAAKRPPARPATPGRRAALPGRGDAGASPAER